jgi:translation initiation factor 2 subunit 2
VEQRNPFPQPKTKLSRGKDPTYRTIRDPSGETVMEEHEYEALLERARSQVPKEVFEKKHRRLTLSAPNSRTQGSRTILYNLREIAEQLNREPHHLLKFLSKEMGTAGTIEGTYAVFQGKFERTVFENLLNQYMQDYLTCPVCRGIDTKISKEGRYYFLLCEACGARNSIKAV